MPHIWGRRKQGGISFVEKDEMSWIALRRRKQCWVESAMPILGHELKAQVQITNNIVDVQKVIALVAARDSLPCYQECKVPALFP
jgi:hypothetical protein